MSNTMLYVPIEQIVPREDNVRDNLGDLTGLVTSIASMGVIQPLNVTAVGENGSTKYFINAGHRRYAAAVIAGVEEIPVMVSEMTEQSDVTELMLIENLQRQDLSVMEEAKAYARLVDLGLSQAAIAEKIGVSRPVISRRIGLTKLPTHVQVGIDSGDIDIETAGALVKLLDAGGPELVDTYLNHSVWQIEQAIEKIKDEKHVAKMHDAIVKAGYEPVTSNDMYLWLEHETPDPESEDPEDTIGVTFEKIDTLEFSEFAAANDIVAVGLRAYWTGNKRVWKFVPLSALPEPDPETGELPESVPERQRERLERAASGASQVDAQKEQAKKHREAAKKHKEFVESHLGTKLDADTLNDLFDDLLQRHVARSTATVAAKLLSLEPGEVQGQKDYVAPFWALWRSASPAKRKQLQVVLILAETVDFTNNERLRKDVVKAFKAVG